MRADVYATIIYWDSSNRTDKFDAFMDGYKYAHKEMKEEMDKAFNEEFDYLKLCSLITDSRYTNDSMFNTYDVKVGTRIMYDNMYGKLLTFIHDSLDAEKKTLDIKIADEWIIDNGNTAPSETLICVEVKHCGSKKENTYVLGKFRDDGFYLSDGGELSIDWDIIRWKILNT